MKLLDTLTEAAQKDSLVFVLIGGHAVNAYGERRQTGDVDLLVPEAQQASWKDLLETLGYKLFHEHKAFLQFSPPELGEWPVDIMLVDENTFLGVMAESQSISFSGAHEVRIPSIEHLIALKLHAVTQVGKTRELKDLADIVALVKIAGLDPKTEQFRTLCEKYGSIELYEKIVEASSS